MSKSEGAVSLPNIHSKPSSAGGRPGRARAHMWPVPRAAQARLGDLRTEDVQTAFLSGGKPAPVRAHLGRVTEFPESYFVEWVWSLSTRQCLRRLSELMSHVVLFTPFMYSRR